MADCKVNCKHQAGNSWKSLCRNMIVVSTAATCLDFSRCCDLLPTPFWPAEPFLGQFGELVSSVCPLHMLPRISRISRGGDSEASADLWTSWLFSESWRFGSSAAVCFPLFWGRQGWNDPFSGLEAPWSRRFWGLSTYGVGMQSSKKLR